MTNSPRIQTVGTCPHCGKQCHVSRKAAKKAGRTIHPGAHLGEYQCGDFWHYGNLPAVVRHGHLTRDDLTPRPDRRPA